MKIKRFLLVLLIAVIPCLSVSALEDDGKIFLKKTATKSDETYGRSATIKLEVSANEFDVKTKTDVVLVLDRSSSMNGNKMIATKKAAKDLVESLLTDKTKEVVRVGLVVYGKNVITDLSSNKLTNDKKDLNELIDSIKDINEDYGTNIHAGLKASESLLNTTNDRIVILLSDGVPTYYLGKKNNICGKGSVNKNDNDNNCKIIINEQVYNTPGSVSSAYSTILKDKGIKIYTIGFDIENEGAKVLNSISSDPDNTYSYLAKDYTSLKNSFDLIIKNFTTIATDAVVEDIVPNGFTVSDLPENASMEVNEEGTVIKWNIGDIKSTESNTLEYTIIAVDNHFGSMFTNTSAVLTAKNVEGNTVYDENIELYFDKPIINVPTITKSDEYNTHSKDKLVVDKASGLLSNDLLKYSHNDGEEITNKIILLSSVEVTDGVAGNTNDIKINDDGSFTYIANNTGKFIYKYYIMSTIGEESGVVNSNTSTITINVNKKETSYVVNYYEEGTTNKLLDSKRVSNVYLNDTVKETSLNIEGYTVDTANKSLKLNLDNNEINFYYKKNIGKVITKYVDMDNNEISGVSTKEGIVGTNYKTESKSIKNYALMKVNGNEEGKYTEEDIVVTYIYEKVPYTGVYVKNASYIIPTISFVALSILGILKKINK